MIDPDGQPLVQLLQDAVNDVIDRFRDQGITLAETVGVLEIVKHDILSEGADD